MSAIDKAIEDLESREQVDSHMYGEVALKYGCSRSAVSRRWRGVSRTRTTRDGEKQVIPPQQELELVQYIIDLHKNGLAPIREMIQNFGLEVAGTAVSKSWFPASFTETTTSSSFDGHPVSTAYVTRLILLRSITHTLINCIRKWRSIRYSVV
jgi:hypothetical protein